MTAGFSDKSDSSLPRLSWNKRLKTSLLLFIVLLIFVMSLNVQRICLWNSGNVLQADEELYHSQLQMIRRLALALKTADNQRNGCGALSREEFTSVLTQFFPLKPTETVARLVQAAASELNVAADDPLLYENLFTEVLSHVLFSAFVARDAFVERIVALLP